MAKLSARGRNELIRWFDLDRGAQLALMSDGRTLCRTPFRGWKEYAKYAGPSDRCPTLAAYLELKTASVRRRDRQVRTGSRCECATPHDLRAWGKSGRVDPCPCPNPRPYVKHPAVVIGVDMPTQSTLEDWVSDASSEAVDGCDGIEPDGECCHGFPAWPRALHII